jgi:hypothetical protein
LSRKFRYQQQGRDGKGRYVAALGRDRDLDVIRRMEGRFRAESDALKREHVAAVIALEGKIKDLANQLDVAKSKQRRPPGPVAGVNLIMGLMLAAVTVTVPLATLAWPYRFPHIGHFWLIVSAIIVAAWVLGLIVARGIERP